MRRIVSFFLLLFFSCTLRAQNLKQKIMVTDAAGIFYRDGSHQKIYVFPFLINDSTSDEQLLDATDTLNFLIPGVYGLSEQDSSHYSVMVMHDFVRMRTMIFRFDSAGNYLCSILYNSEHLRNGAFMEYYPGIRIKTWGAYYDGKKIGTWRYYNEKGRLVRKEFYSNGAVISSKEIKHPHRDPLALSLKKYSPVPYKIVDEDNSEDVVFAEDSIPANHYPFAFGLNLNYFHTNFDSLRSEPWMLNSPPNRSIDFGTELTFGYREKFFVTGTMCAGFTFAKSGIYSNYGNVHVNIFNYRFSVLAHMPIFKLKQSKVFIFAGPSWATVYAESVHYANTNSASYFEESEIKQSPMASFGLMYDRSRRPNVTGFSTYFCIHAGYNLPLSVPTWTYPGTKFIYTQKPSVSLGGLYIGVSMKFWRAKKVRR